MVNKCVAYGCKTGYLSTRKDNQNVVSFRFPLDKLELLEQWTRFVNRRDWKPTSNSVLCANHFEEKYIIRGKRNKLKWDLNPIPSINSAETLKRPSTLPTPVSKRNPPKKRIIQDDQLSSFRENDIIEDFDILSEKHSPNGFLFQKTEQSVIFYHLVYDEKTEFPDILETIKIDRQLHVQLQYNGNPIPLPPWFTQGRDASVNRISMLQNFSSYIRNVVSSNSHSLLDQMKERMYYKPKGRPPYSAEMIRYVLHLRYTSLQAYKIVLEKFPLPSISLLNKIQQGGVDAIKAVTFLREKGEISTDCILMVDEMYLQKATQYQGGEYVGVDKEGNLFKGIVVFMIVGLKESISYVIQALPEITFNGKWLSEKMSKSIDLLGEAGFNVRGIVTDNHAANVNAFKCLHIEYGTPESPLFIKHPSNHNKNIYLFFDSVHILKNIRNNLLNAKKFVFPEFDYENENMSIHFPAGYITWSDLHTIYDKDEKLASNLKKAHKLTYTALHPGNNKQNVPLALAIFDESTIAATKSYLPERHDIAGFLTLIQKWWTVANSKQRFSPNVLGNAIIRGDGKTNFFMSLADWVENWKQSPAFRLTPQTASALIVTLRAQALLIDELLEEGYLFVLTGRLQSDPIERRFSQYRQMSGGRFLVSLREVFKL